MAPIYIQTVEKHLVSKTFEEWFKIGPGDCWQIVESDHKGTKTDKMVLLLLVYLSDTCICKCMSFAFSNQALVGGIVTANSFG